MASYIYGDETPESYRRLMRRLRVDLEARGVVLHPLEVEPLGVVNAAISRLTLMQQCWEEMGRLADYLYVHYPAQMAAAPREGLTADVVIGLLERQGPEEVILVTDVPASLRWEAWEEPA